ncbi:MAG: tRNA epoxyqueuosine(34) reductase QueG [Anaerolineales bacterium]
MDKKILTQKIKQEAALVGFPLVGVTSPDPPDRLDFFHDWIKSGYFASMDWIAAERSLARRADPRKILPECQSILVLASPYPAPMGNVKGGKIASYALNKDYHDVLIERLQLLVESLEVWVGTTVPNRWYTDTGPILEKELAMRAGLGWIGKNTTLINKKIGSYFFLAEILLGIELVTDEPITESFCGSCTLCLDTCPTGALRAPYTLDANRCISYLTIEHGEEIPLELRPQMGDWIFGCDICQVVCPWNKPSAEAAIIIEDLQPREELANLDLDQELCLSQSEFSARFRGSPIKRAKRRGYLRNVAVVLGNLKNPAALPALAAALEDPEPLVRAHAAWALGEIGGEEALTLLNNRAKTEVDLQVLLEIQGAVKTLSKRAIDS